MLEKLDLIFQFTSLVLQMIMTDKLQLFNLSTYEDIIGKRHFKEGFQTCNVYSISICIGNIGIVRHISV